MDFTDDTKDNLEIFCDLLEAGGMPEVADTFRRIATTERESCSMYAVRVGQQWAAGEKRLVDGLEDAKITINASVAKALVTRLKNRIGANAHVVEFALIPLTEIRKNQKGKW